MRCVHFITNVLLERGGPIRTVLDLCAQLGREGDDVTLATTNPRDLPQSFYQGQPGVRTVVLPGLCPPAEWLPPRTLRVMAGILQRAEVLHLHELWCLAGLQLGWLARSLGVPYVLSVHGSLNRWGLLHKPRRKRIFLRLLGARTIAWAARIHCGSRAELALAEAFLRGKAGVVIPPLCDFSRLRGAVVEERVLASAPALRQGLPRVLFLGRLIASKGAELLLQAAALAARAGRPFLLVLAGPGAEDYCAALRHEARRLGLGAQVVLTGMVEGELKAGLLQHCDILCLPTEHESFGLALVEALAMGLPVVTTPGAFLAQELPAGMVVAERSPEGLWAALDALLQRPREERRALGQKGQAVVLRELDPSRVCGAYQGLYREVARAQP